MPCDTPPLPEDDLEDPEVIDGEDFLFEIIGDAADFDDLTPLPADDAVITFSSHIGEVYCCDLDKTGSFAVSGGKDDKGYVWNSKTGELVFECSGHLESVTSVGFSHDSLYVATADLSGLIQVWDLKSGAKEWSFETSEITWLEWHPNRNTLFAGALDGDWKWDIPDGETQIFQTYGAGSRCGCIMPEGEKSVIGYADGSLRFWDINKASVLSTLTGSSAHAGAILKVACHNDNALVATASEDGKAKLIKSPDAKVLFTMDCVNPETSDSVESVAFFQTHPLLATGTAAGKLDIWDISSKVLRSTCMMGSAIVKLICDSVSPVVYVASIDGSLSLFDGRTGDVQSIWRGHTAGILDFVLSNDRETALTCSEDFTCRIWNISQT